MISEMRAFLAIWALILAIVISTASFNTKDEPKDITMTSIDCSTYNSCTQCVSSSTSCNWCLGNHKCTNDTTKNCQNDILISSVNQIGWNYRAGSDFCPKINASEILVPSGLKKRIRVKAHIIDPFIIQTRFLCQFNIEGQVKMVNAMLIGDTIYCDQMEFKYTSNLPNITASFAVIWGGSKPLDNPDNVHVLIYSCRQMADSCKTCLDLPEKFSCGWCQSSNLCELNEQCNKEFWLNRKQTCSHLN